MLLLLFDSKGSVVTVSRNVHSQRIINLLQAGYNVYKGGSLCRTGGATILHELFAIQVGQYRVMARSLLGRSPPMTTNLCMLVAAVAKKRLLCTA